LRKGANLVGDVKTSGIVIEDGAYFRGESTSRDLNRRPKTAPPKLPTVAERASPLATWVHLPHPRPDGTLDSERCVSAGPVGRDTVGGAEQIVAALDRALAAQGHRSFVIAARGSKVSGTHISTPVWAKTIDGTVERWARAAHARVIRQTLEENRIDVVHLHGLDFADYLPDPPVPALATLHLPPAEYPSSVFNLSRPGTYLNCVSSHQLEQCPPCSLPIRTIPNGVDVTSYATKAAKRNYVLALGRICPEKGFHFALDAARVARVPIIWADRYFHSIFTSVISRIRSSRD